MVKVAQKRESSGTIGDVRCVTVQAKPAEIHSTCIRPRGVFVKACPMYVDRTRTHTTAEQQPEGWRFVPDTILPGYQWAPQWVPARTPTVHWGPISGKAVGGPNTVQHSRSQCEKHPKHGSGATSIQGKSFGNKSTVDESLLCYGGPRDEEVDETIHENFDEKECYDNGCKPLMLIMRVFEVVDEKRENEVREASPVREGWSKRHQGAYLDVKRKQDHV